MTLGEKIQMLRNKEGLSQEQLAEHLAVSRQAVSKWELGQSTPDLDYVVQLGELFNVSLDYLVKDKDFSEISSQYGGLEQGKVRNALEDTVFTKIPFPFSIPVFIVCSLFGFHKGWNWFGKAEPTLLQRLPIPFIVAILYVVLCLSGLTAWHPFWVVFLIVPLYYVIAGLIAGLFSKSK
ncbi:MAG: helix-turn-helix domain-containing protein [Lachnospiraceae bacterium]|nr:helix-turn-helix domain-containing protein [Lachnospiraceae bacterium]